MELNAIQQWIRLLQVLGTNGELESVLGSLIKSAEVMPEKLECIQALRATAEQIEKVIVREHYNSFEPIFFVSQPQTASNYIEQELARRLNIFIGHLGLVNDEYHQNGTLNFPRLERFLSIGGIVREHLSPTDINIQLLNASPIKKILLTVRDPRQCVLSEIRFIESLETQLYMGHLGAEGILLQWQIPKDWFLFPREVRIDTYIEHRLPALVKFLEGWWHVLNDQTLNFAVCLTRFEDLKKDYNEFFCRILNFYNIPLSAFEGEAHHSKQGEHAYRKGQVDEWREVLTSAQQKKLEDMVPAALLENYGWSL